MIRMMHSISLAGLAFASIGFANSTGAPLGHTGAPGDFGTCAACHGGAGGPGRISISFPGGSTYNPGQTYRVRVTLEDPTARRWGYSASVKKEASADPAGSIAVPAVTPVVSQLIGPGSNRYLTHHPGGTFRQQQ